MARLIGFDDPDRADDDGTAIPFSARETPVTANGMTPDFPSDVGPQSTRIVAEVPDPVIAGEGYMDIHPNDAPFGSGSVRE